VADMRKGLLHLLQRHELGSKCAGKLVQIAESAFRTLVVYLIHAFAQQHGVHSILRGYAPVRRRSHTRMLRLLIDCSPCYVHAAGPGIRHR